MMGAGPKVRLRKVTTVRIPALCALQVLGAGPLGRGGFNRPTQFRALEL